MTEDDMTEDEMLEQFLISSSSPEVVAMEVAGFFQYCEHDFSEHVAELVPAAAEALAEASIKDFVGLMEFGRARLLRETAIGQVGIRRIDELVEQVYGGALQPWKSGNTDWRRTEAQSLAAYLSDCAGSS